MAEPNLNEAVVAVAPTSTTLGGPFTVTSQFYNDTILLRITNSDGSQSLDAWVEVSWTGGTIYDKWQDNYFMGIPAGECRQKEVNIGSNPVFRVQGTASGAGLNCKISVKRVVQANR